MIGFCKRVKGDEIDVVPVRQQVRAGTSVGANDREANDSESKKNFRHNLSECRKGSKESKHWLRMVAAANPDLQDDIESLWREAKESNLIFGKIRRSCN